ncbi:unnamed protein product, partial [Iphiclides podalirius]
MLDLLLQAEKQGSIDAQGIKEEVDTFMFGGHDTSATALQYILMVFANHPDVQMRVLKEYDEVSESLESFAGSFSLNDLSKLKYLDCCVKECLRLYPSVPFIIRSIEHTVKLSHKYAMIQMKLAILDILKTYKLLPVTKPEDVKFTSDLMLRSTEHVYVKFELRNK